MIKQGNVTVVSLLSLTTEDFFVISSFRCPCCCKSMCLKGQRKMRQPFSMCLLDCGTLFALLPCLLHWFAIPTANQCDFSYRRALPAIESAQFAEKLPKRLFGTHHKNSGLRCSQTAWRWPTADRQGLRHLNTSTLKHANKAPSSGGTVLYYLTSAI